ncbi:MAG: type II secretion system protein M, partial [Gemmatimonadetes bacterium]|nr:type II secretion system protein M [Gemmatimonadota bacterium]
MALIPTSQRDQKMLLVCILALGLAGAYWYVVWSPANTELDATEAHIESLRSVNQTAKSELAQGKTAQLRAETE